MSQTKRDIRRLGVARSTRSPALNGLTDWDSVRPDVARLGARHAGYGARAEDYPVVGAALLATLAKGLGDDFTPAVEDAWTAAFTAISAEMLAASA